MSKKTEGENSKVWMDKMRIRMSIKIGPELE